MSRRSCEYFFENGYQSANRQGGRFTRQFPQGVSLGSEPVLWWRMVLFQYHRGAEEGDHGLPTAQVASRLGGELPVAKSY